MLQLQLVLLKIIFSHFLVHTEVYFIPTTGFDFYTFFTLPLLSSQRYAIIFTIASHFLSLFVVEVRVSRHFGGISFAAVSC